MASLPPIDLPKGATGEGAFDAPADDAARGMLFETLLRLGDDSLILGQRLGEWCGHAPSVEVDLSLANMGLDLIGQATHFLNAAGAAEGKGRDGDGSPFTATCSISAIAGWSSSRTAISPRPWRGNSCSRPGRRCCSTI